MAAELPADWSPRNFRAGDEEGILRVLQSAFERWPRGELTVAPIEHLRWKLSSADVALRHHRIADVNGDSFFDADVASALIVVGGDCSSAPPPSTPQLTPGGGLGGSAATPGPADGAAPSDNDLDEEVTSSQETDSPANDGDTASHTTDEQDRQDRQDEQDEQDEQDDDPGQPGQSTTGDSSSGLPTWAWVLAAIGSISAIGAACVFAVRTLGNRSATG